MINERFTWIAKRSNPIAARIRSPWPPHVSYGGNTACNRLILNMFSLAQEVIFWLMYALEASCEKFVSIHARRQPLRCKSGSDFWRPYKHMCTKPLKTHIRISLTFSRLFIKSPYWRDLGEKSRNQSFSPGAISSLSKLCPRGHGDGWGGLVQLCP